MTKKRQQIADPINSLHRAKLASAGVEQLLSYGQDRVRAKDEDGAKSAFEKARAKIRAVDEYVDRMVRSFAIAGSKKLTDLCPKCLATFESKSCSAEHGDIHAAIKQRGSLS